MYIVLFPYVRQISCHWFIFICRSILQSTSPAVSPLVHCSWLQCVASEFIDM